jgi:apolipoprotein N-acyltransferase
MGWRAAIGWGALAVASFHLAFFFPSLAFLIAFYLLAAFRLSEVATPRRAMWSGVVVGMLCFGPQLGFFYTIFGFSAVALWSVLAFWLGMYVMAQHLVRDRCGVKVAMWFAPVLWMGFEFFRSELYFLRFTWLSAGYAFAEGPNLAVIYWPGVYGVGFLLMAAVVWPLLPRNRAYEAGQGFFIGLLALHCSGPHATPTAEPADGKPLRVAAVQIEHKHDLEVLEALKLLRAKHPEAEVLVLSELAFDGIVPARVRKWCAQEKVHLVAGGKDPVSLDGKVFYNSVFVVGPDGNVLHKQAKTIPIQLMADGQPAPHQTLWDSPWGKLGFCICYDKSFTSVTDKLVRLGAQALIVPTADEIEWGAYEHRLHARIAPVRAAEHRLPVLRVASSGISQLIERDGRVTATAPYPGDLALLNGTLRLGETGRIPPDRSLGRICAWSSWALLAWLAFAAFRQRKQLSPAASKS